MKAFIARQPILDVKAKVYGYEFLYRDSEENYFRQGINGTKATKSLVSNLLTEFDLNKLTGGRYAFINLTEELLRSDFILYLDPKKVIIEILETVQGDVELVQHLNSFKAKGYLFALDDYTGEENILIDVVNIIKVDIRMTSLETQRMISRTFQDKILLAEKVETQEEFLRLSELDYRLFQGYYFSKPTVLSEKVVEISLGSYLKLWHEINQPEISFEQVKSIIHLDVNISFKLMARINSMEYFRGNYLTSVKSALVRMGYDELKRWILLLLLRDCFGKNGDTFAKRSLIRAIFMENMVSLLNYRGLKDEAYIVGLFSNIDAVANRQLEEILETLYISEKVKNALLGYNGVLSDILYFTKQYEIGNWDFIRIWLTTNNMDIEVISSLYIKAVELAENEFF